MEKKLSIAFIGGGQMARAMVSGLHQKDFQITVACPTLQKLEALKKDFAVSITESNSQAAKAADVLILATKPQQFHEACRELSSVLSKNTLIISIMAGVSIRSMQAVFKDQTIVRSMPNTPALIGESITGIFAPTLTLPQKLLTEEILTSIGRILWLSNEESLHTVTALSGSGPAYFFYWMAHMIKAGCQEGLNPDEATKLVLQTAKGASMLALHSQDSVETLQKNVTSKGGTTEAALQYLQQQQVGEHLIQAVLAAKKQSELLAAKK